jgi:hypothetical protein
MGKTRLAFLVSREKPPPKAAAATAKFGGEISLQLALISNFIQFHPSSSCARESSPSTFGHESKHLQYLCFISFGFWMSHRCIVRPRLSVATLAQQACS